MEIDLKYKSILLESLEEMMYKISLQLAAMKGKPLSQKRKELTQKQTELEELQHLIHTFKT